MFSQEGKTIKKSLRGHCFGCRLCMCVCIYLIAHNHAIRPCYPSHSCQWYLIPKPLIGRDKGPTLSPHFLLKSRAPCAFYSLDFLDRHVMKTTSNPFLSTFVSPSAQVSSVFSHRVYNASGVSCAPSPPLRPPRSCPSPTVPGLWPSS